MSSKDWRADLNISAYSSTSKVFNSNESVILIWCDISINKDEQHDQYILSQFHIVSEQVITFTDEQGCMEYINKFQEKNKLLLIVSGSLGQSFIPKICHLSQIYSIYIFCGRKIYHEFWAKKYKKIKGVFDKTTELCKDLQDDKQKLERDRMCQKIVDSLSKIFPLSLQSDEFSNIKNSKYNNDHQPKDDAKKPVASTNASFNKEVEMNNNIHYSETVAPYMPYKQQIEFADTGIWPCVSVIDSIRNDLVNHLHSAIENMQYFNSTENFLQHFSNHPVDPHLIILSNPINIENVSRLIHHRVRRVYIYCSNNRLDEYDTWRESYPHIISVLQHFDTLTRLILWDLSACIVDIGNYYDSENKKDLAQTRYRYAYRLHYMIQGDLNNRTEMIEYTQSVKLNN